MKKLRNNELTERRSAAVDAKASLLSAYRAAKIAAEPLQATRQAERIAVADARVARRIERDRLRLEEQMLLEAQFVAQQASEQAAAVAETEARASANHDRIARVVEDEAARKAERDKRYANRKARQA